MTAEADIALNQTFRVELDLLARNPSPTPFPAPLAPVLRSTFAALAVQRSRQPISPPRSRANTIAAQTWRPWRQASITGQLVWVITRRAGFFQGEKRGTPQRSESVRSVAGSPTQVSGVRPVPLSCNAKARSIICCHQAGTAPSKAPYGRSSCFVSSPLVPCSRTRPRLHRRCGHTPQVHKATDRTPVRLRRFRRYRTRCAIRRRETAYPARYDPPPLTSRRAGYGSDRRRCKSRGRLQTTPRIVSRSRAASSS